MALKTPLYQSHLDMKATMVEFAGYDMPIKYMDLIDEHIWTRKSCGAFDVSHMGQSFFYGNDAIQIFSTLTPTDFTKSKERVCKYTVLTNERGGIIDDLIVTKISPTKLFVVWNASRKNVNLEHLLKHFPMANYEILNEHTLIAIQGPKTFDVLKKIFPEIIDLKYMTLMEISHPKYGEIIITRTGYTGEIGFEISIKNNALELWNEFLQHPFVRPIGLGARDTLRLEVGYPLYGNDIDDKTDPVSAGLSWVMTKDHSCYVGHEAISKIVHNGTKFKRVGVMLNDVGVLRKGYKVFYNGDEVGVITSGGYSPVLKKSIGQCYLPSSIQSDDSVHVEIRSKKLSARVCEICFVKTNPK